jgi:hypothetical protein
VWADEPLALGLAALSGTRGDALPDTLPLPVPGLTLVVMNAEADPAWWTAAERHWFSRAKAALASGALEELIIEGAQGAHYQVTRHGLNHWWSHWWRGRRPVSDHL